MDAWCLLNAENGKAFQLILPVAEKFNDMRCAKSVRIRSYSGPHFPAFALKTERYEISLPIQSECGSECGKMRTRITPNTDTF